MKKILNSIVLKKMILFLLLLSTTAVSKIQAQFSFPIVKVFCADQFGEKESLLIKNDYEYYSKQNDYLTYRKLEGNTYKMITISVKESTYDFETVLPKVYQKQKELILKHNFKEISEEELLNNTKVKDKIINYLRILLGNLDNIDLNESKLFDVLKTANSTFYLNKDLMYLCFCSTRIQNDATIYLVSVIDIGKY